MTHRDLRGRRTRLRNVNVVMSVNLDAKVIYRFVAESRELSTVSKEVQLRDAHVRHLG